MKILLDLNHTLVDSPRIVERIRPFENQIAQEKYRQWLVDNIKNEYVILITVRPVKYKAITLEHIKALTNWQPQESYFGEIKNYPQVMKQHLLRKYILSKKKFDSSEYFAIESNPKTRSIYESYGIKSLPAVSDTGEKIFIDYNPF